MVQTVDDMLRKTKKNAVRGDSEQSEGQDNNLAPSGAAEPLQQGKHEDFSVKGLQTQIASICDTNTLPQCSQGACGQEDEQVTYAKFYGCRWLPW